MKTVATIAHRDTLGFAVGESLLALIHVAVTAAAHRRILVRSVRAIVDMIADQFLRDARSGRLAAKRRFRIAFVAARILAFGNQAAARVTFRIQFAISAVDASQRA